MVTGRRRGGAAGRRRRTSTSPWMARDSDRVPSSTRSVLEAWAWPAPRFVCCRAALDARRGGDHDGHEPITSRPRRPPRRRARPRALRPRVRRRRRSRVARRPARRRRPRRPSPASPGRSRGRSTSRPDRRPYTLEVSSPGLERTCARRSTSRGAVGDEVKVKLDARRRGRPAGARAGSSSADDRRRHRRHSTTAATARVASTTSSGPAPCSSGAATTKPGEEARPQPSRRGRGRTHERTPT